jgi:hypothetical protein
LPGSASTTNPRYVAQNKIKGPYMNNPITFRQVDMVKLAGLTGVRATPSGRTRMQLTRHA